MKNKTILLSALLISGAMGAQAQAAKSVGYWYNPAGELVRTDFGECWRTTAWNESNALAECEGKMKAPKKDGDADKDGVMDSKDQCPGTAAGVKVDAKGCALDSDKDGVIDSSDKCPGTPAGVKVDAMGCAVVMDEDGDGIVDSADKCPGTAAGVVVNQDGCKLKANISLENVQFKTGTAILDSNSRSILDRVASTLKQNDHLSFEVAGHTDSVGNYNSNVRLSAARAESVRKYLIDNGIAADRLVAKGYGPDRPVASNATRDGRSQNRRVELVLK